MKKKTQREKTIETLTKEVSFEDLQKVGFVYDSEKNRLDFHPEAGGAAILSDVYGIAEFSMNNCEFDHQQIIAWLEAAYYAGWQDGETSFKKQIKHMFSI